MKDGSTGDGYENRFVAITEPGTSHEQSKFRLGIRKTEIHPTFHIGQKGPGKREFSWIYLRCGNAFYELDLIHGLLTICVAFIDGRRQAVTYQIDSELMNGQTVQEGSSLEIVFNYSQKSCDNTPEVDDWLATTKLFSASNNLRTPLTSHSLVHAFHSALSIAKDQKRSGQAIRAPRSAHPIEQPHIESPGEITAAHALKGLMQAGGVGVTKQKTSPKTGPTTIAALDPSTGTTFQAHRWTGEDDQLDLSMLKSTGYRVVFLQMQDGESASIAIQPRQPLIQITTRRGVLDGRLDEMCWANPIRPGSKFSYTIETSSNPGLFPVGDKMHTAPVAKIVATRQPLGSFEAKRLEPDDVISSHRKVVKARMTEEPKRGRVKNHSRGVA